MIGKPGLDIQVLRGKPVWISLSQTTLTEPHVTYEVTTKVRALWTVSFHKEQCLKTQDQCLSGEVEKDMKCGCLVVIVLNMYQTYLE